MSESYDVTVKPYTTIDGFDALVSESNFSACDQCANLLNTTIDGISRAVTALYRVTSTNGSERAYIEARDEVLEYNRFLSFSADWSEDFEDRETSFRITLPKVGKFQFYIGGALNSRGEPYLIRLGYIPYVGSPILKHTLDDAAKLEDIKKFVLAVLP